MSIVVPFRLVSQLIMVKEIVVRYEQTSSCGYQRFIYFVKRNLYMGNHCVCDIEQKEWSKEV